jgi:hypothetical protein
MRFVGVGSKLWRVRVDLFTADDPGDQVDTCAQSLTSLLDVSDGAVPGDCCIDQGLGIAASPVIGFLFWVGADDVGHAAMTAVATARRAGADAGAGTDLYDVTVIPSTAVAQPNDPTYPPMPD